MPRSAFFLLLCNLCSHAVAIDHSKDPILRAPKNSEPAAKPGLIPDDFLGVFVVARWTGLEAYFQAHNYSEADHAVLDFLRYPLRWTLREAPDEGEYETLLNFTLTRGALEGRQLRALTRFLPGEAARVWLGWAERYYPTGGFDIPSFLVPPTRLVTYERGSRTLVDRYNVAHRLWRHPLLPPELVRFTLDENEEGGEVMRVTAEYEGIKSQLELARVTPRVMRLSPKFFGRFEVDRSCGLNYIAYLEAKGFGYFVSRIMDYQMQDVHEISAGPEEGTFSWEMSAGREYEGVKYDGFRLGQSFASSCSFDCASATEEGRRTETTISVRFGELVEKIKQVGEPGAPLTTNVYSISEDGEFLYKTMSHEGVTCERRYKRQK